MMHKTQDESSLNGLLKQKVNATFPECSNAKQLLKKNAVRYLIIQIEMRSISTFFSCIEKVQIKSSKQSTSSSLHRHHFRERKNLLKIKCTEYFKNKPKQAGNCFWLAFRDMECSRGKNAANNSLHILRMFWNAANWNYLILSITKSNFLFICVSGSIKLKQWLLYASRVLLFFHSFVMFPVFQADFSSQKKNDVDICAMRCESWEWWMKKRWNMKNSMKWKPFNMNDVILLKFQLRCLDAIQWTFRRK